MCHAFCSEARRSRIWDCLTESDSFTNVSTSVSTVAARRPRALETYSANSTRLEGGEAVELAFES